MWGGGDLHRTQWINTKRNSKSIEVIQESVKQQVAIRNITIKKASNNKKVVKVESSKYRVVSVYCLIYESFNKRNYKTCKEIGIKTWKNPANKNISQGREHCVADSELSRQIL